MNEPEHSGSISRLGALRFVLVASSLLTLWLIQPSTRIAAQVLAHEWSDPSNVSNTSATQSASPQVAVGGEGAVHVVWGEQIYPGSELLLDTIYYTRLENEQWTAPTDVIAVQPDNALTIDTFLIDRDGALILVWHQVNALQVSKSLREEAAGARGWHTVTVDGPGAINGADLAVDERNIYHLVYTTNDGMVYYSRSADAGESWAEPVRAAGMEESTEATSAPDIAVGDLGMIYISWTANRADTNWGPAGVWFSRSSDGGQSWAKAMELARGIGYGAPDLLVDGTGNVHALWIGNLSAGGRYHRWSGNNGQDWHDTVTVAPRSIRGYAGKGTLLADSLGRLYAIFAGRDQNGEAIWASGYQDEAWSEPLRISGSVPDSQQPSAIIEGGRRVHVVWTEFEEGEIWYATHDIEDAPWVTSKRGASVPALPATPASVAPTDEPIRPAEQATTVPRSTATVQFATAEPRAATVSPLIYAFAAALGLVLVVMMISARRRN